MEQNIERILNTVERTEKKIDSCVLEINVLKEKVKIVEEENKQLVQITTRLEGKIDQLENQSRRNNIVIYGIPEIQDENWEKTEKLLLNFVREMLKIELEQYSVERAYRLGYAKNMKRPIIAKLNNFKTKDLIMKNAKFLKNTEFAISEDYSQKVKDERSQLKPLINIAKEQGKRAFLSFNKISIDGRKYAVEEALVILKCNLPATAVSAPNTRNEERENITDSDSLGLPNKRTQQASTTQAAMDRPRRKNNK